MFRFHEDTVNTEMYLQLQDLTAILSKEPALHFMYTLGSYIDIVNMQVTASTFWENNQPQITDAGLKTDVFLRTIGTYRHTDLSATQDFMKSLEESHLPRLGIQLFTLLENIRLEELIKKERPGTAVAFSVRRHYLYDYFNKQRTANATRSLALDELFCLLFLKLQANHPDPDFPHSNPTQLDSAELVASELYTIFEAASTFDIVKAMERILSHLAPIYHKDMLNEYLVPPIGHIHAYQRQTLFDELTRTDPLANEDEQEVDADKNEVFEETFSTWHQETKNEDRNQTFLQFDIEQGTKTTLIGDGARDTEDGDQAMASMQGKSGKSKQQDYSELETLEKKANDSEVGNETSAYGEDNRLAVAIDRFADTPSPEDIERYADYKDQIEAYQRTLAVTIEKAMEHKRNTSRDALLFGRLSKKLLPLVIEQERHIFYKKDNESKELDAVFSLLVDCSASMHSKMDQTKQAIVLFHEVLQRLKIPHAITGFWEDALAVNAEEQPNYFHRIHTFQDSHYQSNGPQIMQLEAEEDNRDGFSIRIAQEELLEQREKHKFLLVFTDGEPAAANYQENGIVDTHGAVLLARKRGIHTIGIFLADGDLSERDDSMMKSIYRKERMMITDLSELTAQFSPLLKKLLLQSI